MDQPRAFKESITVVLNRPNRLYTGGFVPRVIYSLFRKQELLRHGFRSHKHSLYGLDRVLCANPLLDEDIRAAAGCGSHGAPDAACGAWRPDSPLYKGPAQIRIGAPRGRSVEGMPTAGMHHRHEASVAGQVSGYWNYLSVRSECISDSALLGVDNSPSGRENEKHRPERANAFRFARHPAANREHSSWPGARPKRSLSRNGVCGPQFDRSVTRLSSQGWKRNRKSAYKIGRPKRPHLEYDGAK
jgi:hypothetical protein